MLFDQLTNAYVAQRAANWTKLSKKAGWKPQMTFDIGALRHFHWECIILSHMSSLGKRTPEWLFRTRISANNFQAERKKRKKRRSRSASYKDVALVRCICSFGVLCILPFSHSLPNRCCRIILELFYWFILSSSCNCRFYSNISRKALTSISS